MAILIRIVPALALAALLAACASSDQPKYVEKPVAELYNNGLDALQKGNYKEATDQFDEVERQHPYSIWATKAQLMAAYAYYQNNRYDDAVAGLDRFIELHPSNPDVAYAYYLKGLCYYEQISDVTRDQKMTALALKTLQEVVTRFPHSKYARDAKLKIDLTYDHLAGKEMSIGRYYEDKGDYLAAINRFKNVVDGFQRTTHVPEALHRLVECYTALGLTKEARRTAAVLGHNFPGSEWYVDSYDMVATKKDDGRMTSKKAGAPWYKFW